jgi:hypothetical protein
MDALDLIITRSLLGVPLTTKWIILSFHDDRIKPK